MVLRSTVPLYICFLVLPWMHRASAPPDSAARAQSTALRWLSSIPVRILTVTGRLTAAFTALTIRSIFPGSRISAEPSPLEKILFTGQPIFMSIKAGAQPSVSSVSILAASPITSGLDPKIWSPTAPSSGRMAARAAVFLSPKVTAVALTISLTEYSAPFSLHKRRIARSEKPAIGASDRPILNSKSPILILGPSRRLYMVILP